MWFVVILKNACTQAGFTSVGISSFSFRDRIWIGGKETRILLRWDYGGDADGRHEDVILPSVWLIIAGLVSGVVLAIFLGRSKGEAVDADGDTIVFEPVEVGVDQGFFPKEIVPVAVVEVRGDNGRFPAVAFAHELEEGVDLFGLQIDVTEFIDQEHVAGAQSF